MSDDPYDLIEVLERSRALGFLGPGPVVDHLAHAEAFAAAIGDVPGTVVDLGSGGGVPGLVLACRRPAARTILLDGSVKRAAFLNEVVDELGLADHVEVWAERAEDVGRDSARRSFAEVVVSRSFGAPAVVAECAAPLLCRGGRLVVSEPPTGEQPVGTRWPAEGVAMVGLKVEATIPGPPAFTVLRQERTCPDRYPRRVGIPSKRPLF